MCTHWMCDFCKRYLNTLISGYVNIMSIFALQYCFKFQGRLDVCHSHKNKFDSFSLIFSSMCVCVYIFVQYTWCSCSVDGKCSMKHWKLGRNSNRCHAISKKKKILFDFLPNVVNLRTELHILRVWMCAYFVVVARLMWIECAFDIYRLKPLKTLYSITNGNCTS